MSAADLPLPRDGGPSRGPHGPSSGVPRCPSAEALAAHVDREAAESGALSDAPVVSASPHRGDAVVLSASDVDAHLDGCATCAREVRRLERLSGLLRAWEARNALSSPSERVRTGVLRAVGAAATLDLARARAGRRGVAAAAAVAAFALFAGGAAGAWVGSSAGFPGRGSGAESARALRLRAVDAAVAARDALAVASRLWRVPAPRGVASDVAAAGSWFDDAAARWDAVASSADDLALWRDGAARDGMRRWTTILAARDVFGEDPTLVDGRPLSPDAAREFLRARRAEAWLLERERVALRSPTRDPSAFARSAGALLGLAPPTASAPETAVRVEQAADAAQGGLTLVALASHAASPSAAPRALDLAGAVARGRARLAEDVSPRADAVILRVAPGDAAVLVPAGELLTGGLVDRVVARSAWISASTDAATVRLSCRPVAPVRSRGSAGDAVRPVGALAGPGLRGLLASGLASRRGDPGALDALVEALLDGAGLGGAENRADPERGSLLRLYVATPDGFGVPSRAGRRDRAEVLADALGAGAFGFVASDPSGRLQGVETFGVAPESAAAFLRASLAGYLAEARTRSVGETRGGVDAAAFVARLLQRPATLATADGVGGGAIALHGVEPAGGVVFDGVEVDGAPAFLTALVPDIR